MASLNKVIMMGNLTADPELRQTTSGISVCSFSIAVNRRFAKQDQGQQNVDFFNIVTWRQQAEFVSRYFKKGSNIVICGQLQNRNWTDNQGVKHYATDIVADEVTFGSSSQGGQNNSNYQSNNNSNNDSSTYTPEAYGAPSFNSTQSANFEEIPDDDSLPF